MQGELICLTLKRWNSDSSFACSFQFQICAALKLLKLFGDDHLATVKFLGSRYNGVIMIVHLQYTT